MLETSLQDIRFAVRSLRRSPGFALAAIAALALGIGANTAIFSVVSGVLLRPLPFPDPARLVQLNQTFPWTAVGPVVMRDLVDFREHSHSVEGAAGFFSTSKILQNVPDPEQLATINAERGLFRVLGVSAAAGRTFRDDDPLTVAVVSHAFWTRRLASDPAAAGRTITLSGALFTVIGVMPEGFQFPYEHRAADIWLPWQSPPASNGRINAVARLQPGVGPEAARAELTAMSQRVQADRATLVRPLQTVVGAPVRQSLLVLLGAVGMVLLVACVNVANLLLARAAAREQEVAIRTALGAGRWRLIRQFLTESLLLAFTGGALGLALGIAGRRFLIRAAAAQIPRASEIGMDWRVFAFLLGACLLTGIAFGIVPAVSATRGAAAAAMKARGVRSTFRDGLVVVEVALAFVLLAGAGLLLRTFLNLQRTDSGVDASRVLTLHLVVSGAPELASIEERVARIPGVEAAGFVSLLPLQTSDWAAYFSIPGRAGRGQTELRYVTPGYFSTLGIPLRRGRGLDARDTRDKPIVILINEAFARQYFPNEDPVGRQIDRGLIVGVVADVHQSVLSKPAIPEIYYAMAQNFAQLPSVGSTLVVRGRASISALAGAIREVNANQAVFRVLPMQQVIQESLADQRLYLWLLGLFAALGTVLAAAGIYGVVAYLVTVRTREFGIRMALGADSANVLGLVMGRGAVLVTLGLALGLGGAAALTRFLRTVLFGVGATDPFTFASMAAVLAAVALAACLVPARRAARVSPSTALRAE